MDDCAGVLMRRDPSRGGGLDDISLEAAGIPGSDSLKVPVRGQSAFYPEIRR